MQEDHNPRRERLKTWRDSWDEVWIFHNLLSGAEIGTYPRNYEPFYPVLEEGSPESKNGRKSTLGNFLKQNVFASDHVVHERQYELRAFFDESYLFLCIGHGYWMGFFRGAALEQRSIAFQMYYPLEL